MIFGPLDRVLKCGKARGRHRFVEGRVGDLNLALNRRACLFIDFRAQLGSCARQAVDGFAKYAAQIRHGSQSLTFRKNSLAPAFQD